MFFVVVLSVYARLAMVVGAWGLVMDIQPRGLQYSSSCNHPGQRGYEGPAAIWKVSVKQSLPRSGSERLHPGKEPPIRMAEPAANLNTTNMTTMEFT